MQCERANPCFAPYLCHDKVVGYSCAACPMGYSGGGTSGSNLQDAISKKQVNNYSVLYQAIN